MKKRVLAMLFAVMMLTGCGGAKEEAAPEYSSQAEQMIAYLQQVPAEVTEEMAVANDFYTIKDQEAKNQPIWDAFVEKVENDEEAHVLVCQYSMKDGAVLDFVTYHEGGVFELVTDTTRDGYNDEKSVMRAPETYTELHVFENFVLQEGGRAYTICTLSDDADLTEDDFREYWTEMTMDDHGVHLLYVI